MVDLPILFSAPMVRALIAGRKTQTRRILNLKPSAPILDFIKVATDRRGRSVYEMKGAGGTTVSLPSGTHLQTPHFVAPIAVGDRLYVREHWRVSQKWDETPPRDLPARTMTIFCEAGGSIANQANGRWEPDNDYPPSRPEWVGKHRQAMHMPKWASRITLIVESVKVERLQDISGDDAIAEGAEIDLSYRSPCLDGQIYPMVKVAPGTWMSPVAWYHRLWDQINGAKAWDANPWVVAYTFRRIIGNIDLIEVA